MSVASFSVVSPSFSLGGSGSEELGYNSLKYQQNCLLFEVIVPFGITNE